MPDWFRLIGRFLMSEQDAESPPAAFSHGSGSSTGTRPPHHSAARTSLVLLIRRTVRPRGYASGPSLAAALLDSLFEHLA
jgi:hypothetical protein